MTAAAAAPPAYPLDPTATYVTVAEAVKVRPLPGMSRMTIYRRINDGSLPAWRVGNGRIHFALADLDKLIVQAGPTPQARKQN